MVIIIVGSTTVYIPLLLSLSDTLCSWKIKQKNTILLFNAMCANCSYVLCIRALSMTNNDFTIYCYSKLLEKYSVDMYVFVMSFSKTVIH